MRWVWEDQSLKSAWLLTCWPGVSEPSNGVPAVLISDLPLMRFCNCQWCRRERQDGEAILVNNAPSETTLQSFQGKFLHQHQSSWALHAGCFASSQLHSVSQSEINSPIYCPVFDNCNILGVFFWWYCLKSILVCINQGLSSPANFIQQKFSNCWDLCDIPDKSAEKFLRAKQLFSIFLVSTLQLHTQSSVL